MKLKQLLLVCGLAAGLVGAACLSKENESAGVQMSDAAAKLVNSFNDDQKGKALFAFDDKERTNWWFVPLQKDKKPLRKGLRFDQMTAEQKATARALIRAGTSSSGFLKATTIMSLESILAELEKNGANVRDPGWYFVSVFGTPTKAGKWGWRVEGHHLSLNFVIDRGKIAASTPAFFGANPAEIKGGAKKGQRTLSEAEDYAKELFASLDDGQRKTALQAKLSPEIEQGKPAARPGAAKGLPASQMSEKQRAVLRKLVQAYAERMPSEVAQAEMAEVKSAGFDKVHFAFAQDTAKPGKPYTYHVQGPTFLIEFLNIQSDSAGNPANHIHSCWRNLKGDFGVAIP